MAVRAIPPSSTHRLAFLAMLDDFAEHDPHNTDYYAPARDDFEAYVRSLIDEERGLNLRDGWGPMYASGYRSIPRANLAVNRTADTCFDLRSASRRRGGYLYR